MAKPEWIEKRHDELKSVVKDANGSPVVLSPYGFSIQEINGKKYVVSNTLEDYRNLREKSGLLPDQLGSEDKPLCYMDSNWGCLGACPTPPGGFCGEWSYHDICGCRS